MIQITLLSRRIAIGLRTHAHAFRPWCVSLLGVIGIQMETLSMWMDTILVIRSYKSKAATHRRGRRATSPQSFTIYCVAAPLLTSLPICFRPTMHSILLRLDPFPWYQILPPRHQTLPRIHPQIGIFYHL